MSEVLTNIVTREPYRKRGAGSMILRWGLAEAKKAGVPAYLEAVSTARPLYEKHGFRTVGTQVVHLGPGADLELSRMRADP